MMAMPLASHAQTYKATGYAKTNGTNGWFKRTSSIEECKSKIAAALRVAEYEPRVDAGGVFGISNKYGPATVSVYFQCNIPGFVSYNLTCLSSVSKLMQEQTVISTSETMKNITPTKCTEEEEKIIHDFLSPL